jgi:hypothetical protein
MDPSPLTPEAVIGLIERYGYTVVVESRSDPVVITARNTRSGELAVGTNEKGDELAALALVARQIHLKVPGLDTYRDLSDTIQ